MYGGLTFNRFILAGTLLQWTLSHCLSEISAITAQRTVHPDRVSAVGRMIQTTSHLKNTVLLCLRIPSVPDGTGGAGRVTFLRWVLVILEIAHYLADGHEPDQNFEEASDGGRLQTSPGHKMIRKVPRVTSITLAMHIRMGISK